MAAAHKELISTCVLGSRARKRRHVLLLSCTGGWQDRSNVVDAASASKQGSGLPSNHQEYKFSSQAPSILQVAHSARRGSGVFFNVLLLSFRLNLFFSLAQRNRGVSHLPRDQLSPPHTQSKNPSFLPASHYDQPPLISASLSFSPAFTHCGLLSQHVSQAGVGDGSEGNKVR